MLRIARWSVPLMLVLLQGCQDAPVAPASSVSVTAATSVISFVDLDAGNAVGHNALAVNDSGWVFIQDGTRGLVWLDDVNGAYPADSLKDLQAPVRRATDPNNGRGDYIADERARVAIADGQGGWTLGLTLPAPAMFVDTGAHAWGISDGRVVVGHAYNPERAHLSNNGRRVVQYFYSPVAWTVDEGGVALTATALPLPTPSAGCLPTHVPARGVNNVGVIVGWAGETSSSGADVCPTQAVLWPSATSAPIRLPRATSVPGYPAKIKSRDINFNALDVNDAGVVMGFVSASTVSGSYRAVRWRPLVGGGYGPPEFHGSTNARPQAIDECGRVVLSDGHVWGAAPGDGVVSLPAPAGFGSPAGHDIAGDLVVGEASHPSLGWHAIVWKLNACAP